MAHAGELLFILIFNCIVIFILYQYQKRLIEKNIKHLKEEIHELEDLVAAIIEEFEDIADTNATSKEHPAQRLGLNQDLRLNYPTVGDFLDNMEVNDVNEPVQAVESLRMPLEQVGSMNEGQMDITVRPSEEDRDKDSEPLDELTVSQTAVSQTDTANHQESDEVLLIDSLPDSNPDASIKLELIKDPRHRRIFELWQQGTTVDEIARQLGTGQGVIQLVLGLYRRS